VTEPIEHIRRRFDESIAILQATRDRLAEPLGRAIELVCESLRDGGAVWTFGNGGSAADAQHIAGELVGRFYLERPPLRAAALVGDASVLTSLANDYEFEQVFARQIRAHARAGDVALALTTSGNSPNIVAGLEAARQIGCRTLAFTGEGGGRCASLAEVLLDVPCRGDSPRIQEAHGLLYHLICEGVEAACAKD
jgi:D-sedoheptulose 7-phosphate isomerase